MLNKQGPGKIDWTDYTWNPISGCLHNCSYCYVKAMDKRFGSNLMDPKFHEDRMHDIDKLKKPSRIFVGSSGDMWGEWVNSKWIMEVINAAALKPRHTFQFLTKNPSRYHGWAFSENMWLGTTFDGTDRTAINVADLINYTRNGRRFVSFEPLMGDPVFAIPHISYLNWIIIGADSTRGAEKPPKKWADWLIDTARTYGIPVFVKDNYGYPETIKEFPIVK